MIIARFLLNYVYVLFLLSVTDGVAAIVIGLALWFLLSFLSALPLGGGL